MLPLHLIALFSVLEIKQEYFHDIRYPTISSIVYVAVNFLFQLIFVFPLF